MHLDQSCAYLEIYLTPKGKLVNLKLAYRRIQVYIDSIIYIYFKCVKICVIGVYNNHYPKIGYWTVYKNLYHIYSDNVAMRIRIVRHYGPSGLNQFYTHVPVEKHINLMLFYG